VILVRQETIGGSEIERELESAHQLQATGDVFHGALIEKIGIASGAACSMSGVSIHNHLRIRAAGDTWITYQIEPRWGIVLEPFFRRPDPEDGELVRPAGRVQYDLHSAPVDPFRVKDERSPSRIMFSE
jgi:hypothetical protein